MSSSEGFASSSDQLVIDPALTNPSEDSAVFAALANGVAEDDGHSTLQAAIVASLTAHQHNDPQGQVTFGDEHSDHPTFDPYASANAQAGPSSLPASASTPTDAPASSSNAPPPPPATSAGISTNAEGHLVHDPPPAGPWPTRDEAHGAVREYALTHNFDVNVTHSDVYRRVLTLGCVKGGTYRCTRGPAHEQVRQRGKRTGKTGCMWRVTLRDEVFKANGSPQEGQEVEGRWNFSSLTDLVNEHNHPPITPSENPKARHRTITLEIKEFVYMEVDQGTPTRQIWGKVQKAFPDCLANLVDIKNIVGRRKKDLPTV
ncbi:hypothetical protein I350_07190 [Cryptococcus amylolentus CBS 6273]|uniref:FAR1 domain-containing protein n=1 Tax=Cryptococcus amylolentus CBS 6273 TaxID=1296118 RepID=A0A1E3JDS0_9TREE|nr:hypothetical protein I350_07190 [Cryptococcus amylolentus CBS 6273]